MEKKGLLNRCLLDDNVAGWCLPVALLMVLLTGQSHLAVIGAFLCTAGWMKMGSVVKRQAHLWISLGALVCVVMAWHGSGETWAGALPLFGPAALLYQSLDAEGKLSAKRGCLWIAAGLAVLGIALCYAKAVGYNGLEPETVCLGESFSDGAGLFFAVAALSERKNRRRYLSCVALGLTGSGIGFIALGAGLLFRKQDWISDLLWVITGALFFSCPPNLWFLIVTFLFWCVPETIACIGRGSVKWGFLPFVVSVFNPAGLLALGQFGLDAWEQVKGWEWHILFGTGAGTEMLSGGLIQTMVELGIPVMTVLAVCVASFVRNPSGYAWITGMLFGACGFLPAPFLMGAGCGMGDSGEDKVNGRWYFPVLAVICLFLCSRGT